MQLRSILHLVYSTCDDWIAWEIAVDRETLMLCLDLHHSNSVDTAYEL